MGGARRASWSADILPWEELTTFSERMNNPTRLVCITRSSYFYTLNSLSMHAGVLDRLLHALAAVWVSTIPKQLTTQGRN